MTKIADASHHASEPPSRAMSPEDDVIPDRRSVQRRRLSVEVSHELHRRILTICATRGVPVNQAVREVLNRAFPG